MKAREFTKCMCCDKGMAHNGSPVFLHIKIEYLALDARAIQRQHGLDQLVGSSALGAIMGPDEDMAKLIGSGDRLICGACMLDPNVAPVPFSLFELAISGPEVPL